MAIPTQCGGAFARAVKPMLLFSAIVTLTAALLTGWGAIGVAMLMLLWSVIGTRQYVAHVAWPRTMRW